MSFSTNYKPKAIYDSSLINQPLYYKTKDNKSVFTVPLRFKQLLYSLPNCLLKVYGGYSHFHAFHSAFVENWVRSRLLEPIMEIEPCIYIYIYIYISLSATTYR